MQHLEHQRLDRQTMNGIEMLRPGLGIVQEKKIVQIHVEPIELAERKLYLQLGRKRPAVPIIEKPALKKLIVTRHRKQADRKTNGLAAELVKEPKTGVRLVPIASKRAANLGEMVTRRAELMPGAVREKSWAGHLAEMRQILGKVGAVGAAASSPARHACGRLRSEHEA